MINFGFLIIIISCLGLGFYYTIDTVVNLASGSLMGLGFAYSITGWKDFKRKERELEDMINDLEVIRKARGCYQQDIPDA